MNINKTDKTTASDLMSFATKNSRVNTSVISSCRMHHVTKQLLPQVKMPPVVCTVLRSQPNNAFWDRGEQDVQSFSVPAKNLQELWRHWFSADKHPFRTFPATVPSIFSASSGGKRSSYEHHLGVNNKVVRESSLLLFFIF